jgi:glycosyltransferase involved in cell wall biosynthesis
VTRRILLASYEVPGYGGASTASYRLLDVLRASGLDVVFVNLIDEQDGEFFRHVFGPSYGNPRGLDAVFNCHLSGRLYGDHPELETLLEQQAPDVMIGIGFIAALLLARAGHGRKLVFLTSGCQQTKNAIMRGNARDYLDVKREMDRGIRRPKITSLEERDAVDAADLIVFHSGMTRALYAHYYPYHAGKFAPQTLSFARWIHADAAEHAGVAKPFDERDIDVLFVASDWRRAEKNFAFVEKIAGKAIGRRIDVIGEFEKAARGATHHGLIADRRETFALMGRARTVACPSRFDTAPGVLFEASALGCNVVASENCGNWTLCNEDLRVRDFTPAAFADSCEKARTAKYSDHLQEFLDHGPFTEVIETLDVL